MITYFPSFIIARHGGHCVYGEPYDYLPLYGHLARLVIDWKLPHEILNDTSSIHNGEFYPFSSQDAVETTLGKLFPMVGTDTGHGHFLRRLGFRKWADLAKPIIVPGKQSQWREYDVRERRLRGPGPNKYHPEAVYAHSASFQFGFDRRWSLVFRYGYSREDSRGSSSWDIYLRQGDEALSTFVNVTVPAWLDSKLEPETDPCLRTYRNQEFDRLTGAVACVFGWAIYGTGKASGITTDALVSALLDGHKPELTPRRLSAFRRWMRDDAKEDALRVQAKPKGV